MLADVGNAAEMRDDHAGGGVEVVLVLVGQAPAADEFAQVFHRHANIIVNLGGARAREIRELIALCQDTVRRELGYELKPEIGFIGEF